MRFKKPVENLIINAYKGGLINPLHSEYISQCIDKINRKIRRIDPSFVSEPFGYPSGLRSPDQKNDVRRKFEKELYELGVFRSLRLVIKNGKILIASQGSHFLSLKEYKWLAKKGIKDVYTDVVIHRKDYKEIRLKHHYTNQPFPFSVFSLTQPNHIFIAPNAHEASIIIRKIAKREAKKSRVH